MEIAGYQLLEPLAENGTTTAYLARHDQSAERRYVIKLLKKEFAADLEIAASFLEQAKRAQEIRHPGFVTIYQYGKHDGAPFYVMDYIRGESLENKRDAMCLLDKIYVIKQAARTLEYIAKFDRVHGNINLANIFLHEFGSRVVLTDCGFTQDTSYRIAHPDNAYAMLTGTCISPEQAKFSNSDPRSDIYSLGVVFYTLLAGTPPFVAKTSAGLNAQHVNGQAPDLPEAKRIFQPLITKALAKAPADRFQSASELVLALEQISDEDILRADGIELEAAQEPASEPASVGKETIDAVKANVVPFARKRQVSADERRAGGELAQVLKQTIAPVHPKPGHKPKQAAPKRKSRPVSNPAEKRAALQDKPLRSARKDNSSPLRVDVAPHQIIRRSRKTPGKHRAVVAGITLILLAGIGVYGVQNQAQLAGIYKDKLAPALPPPVVTWLTDAGDYVHSLGGELGGHIVAFLPTRDWAEIGEDMEGVLAKIVPDQVEPRDSPDAGARAQAQTQRLKVIELLALAKTKVDANHLVTPAEESAYVIYQQVLALDENNVAALLGVADIAVQQHSLALEQRNKGNFEEAVELAKSSAQLSPGAAKDVLITQLELQVVEQQRQIQATIITDLLAQAEHKLSDGLVLRPASDNAVVVYRRILVLDPENVIALNALETIKNQALLKVQEKLDSGSLDSADALITRIGEFFRTAHGELEALSTRLMQLRDIPMQEHDTVLTQAFLEDRQEGTAVGPNSERYPL